MQDPHYGPQCAVSSIIWMSTGESTWGKKINGIRYYNSSIHITILTSHWKMEDNLGFFFFSRPPFHLGFIKVPYSMTCWMVLCWADKHNNNNFHSDIDLEAFWTDNTFYLLSHHYVSRSLFSDQNELHLIFQFGMVGTEAANEIYRLLSSILLHWKYH